MYWTFRNGKATQMRAFADRRQALEWVGVKGPNATVTLHHAKPRNP
jgi:hypothetical protein